VGKMLSGRSLSCCSGIFYCRFSFLILHFRTPVQVQYVHDLALSYTLNFLLWPFVVLWRLRLAPSTFVIGFRHYLHDIPA
jgi:hypothetical protein